MNLSAALCWLFAAALLRLGLSSHEIALLTGGALFLLFVPFCLYAALDPGDKVEME